MADGRKGGHKLQLRRFSVDIKRKILGLGGTAALEQGTLRACANFTLGAFQDSDEKAMQGPI